MVDYDNLQEGDVFNSILHRRMISNNQNVLAVITGKTGSGKSYASLRIAELWYQKYFKIDLPVENICFSVEELMKRLVYGNLKRGDLLILEEAGTSMGNLDFQDKVSKMFTYVLQSFRSMNVAIIMNLPYFSMLNKTCRMLTHFLFQTMEIDKTSKKVILKPFQLQYAQDTGKLYKHYPQVTIDGVYEKLEFFSYGIPSEALRNVYEEKKFNFVKGLATDVLEKIKHKVKFEDLPELQQKIIGCWKEGITKQTDLMERLGVSQSYISESVGRLKRKGYVLESYTNIPIKPARNLTYPHPSDPEGKNGR